jgi:hypothetical protein
MVNVNRSTAQRLRVTDLLGPRASRPQTRGQAHAFRIPNSISRFALVAGGTPAVPANYLDRFQQIICTGPSKSPGFWDYFFKYVFNQGVT